MEAANHSKNPISERGSVPLYNFAQPHTLQKKKEFLIFWIANSPPPLKANLFLSFQTVQKINNGMDLQIIFSLFTHKRTLPAKYHLLYSFWKNQLGTEQTKDNLPQHSSYCTMNEQMIYIFLFATT